MTTRLPSWLLGSGVIAIAMGVMNVSTYAFTILAARLLGPSEYGALAALMGLLIVTNVASLGLQATGARRVSASPQDLVHIESEILSASYRSALGLGLVCLLAIPLVTWTLRLDNATSAALLAVTAVPLTVMGGQAGILQGERRWLSLAAIYLAMGVGRVVFGITALLVSPHALSAMVGVAIGAFVPSVIGWFAIRHPGRVRDRAPLAGAKEDLEQGTGHRQVGWSKGGMLREVGHNSHALLVFFALSNVDVVIARVVLEDNLSGLYAGGLILTKAVLFLPQFVVVIAFPSMAVSGARRSMHLKALVVVLGIGALATGGAWALPGLAVTFVGGNAYSDLQPVLWGFAAVGTLLAMIQLMIYSVVARQHQRMVFVVWAGLLAVVGFAPLVSSVTTLLVGVAVVDSCLLAILLLSSLRQPEVEGPSQSASSA
ncbi:MAG TPA: polysaccharide biosynthesis protein [Nocardioidaceae bacterium]|nr:polysaccharide biosynthesis protein [Nocardioidaceae bacterium]